jgi:NAD(P)-dependent dehydrogenase (short-subunit alcohol dehydrogenase family)
MTKNTLDFAGKVAFVTGASSGMGVATAQAFAEGWRGCRAGRRQRGVGQGGSDIAKNVPIARAGKPEEIASAVLWLCSPGASYVVGHALTVDGGMTVI